MFSRQEEPDRTQVSPADRETVEELIPQTLTLGNSRKATILDLLSVHLKGVFGEAETLLNESGKFTDPAALFAQDFLRVSCTNNNLADDDMVKPLNNPLIKHIPRYEHGSLGHRSQSIPPRKVRG